MKQIFFFELFFLLLIANISYSQENCDKDGLYQIDSLGNEVEKIPVALDFIFTKDSVIMCPKGNRIYILAEFKITDKKCEWEEVFVRGTISYKLLLIEKGIERHPVLNLIFINKTSAYIELLFENSEKRVFHRAKLPD